MSSRTWFSSSKSSGAEPEDPEIRIVLLGQAGAEKNTARNIILDKKEFGGDPTTSCQLGIREWEGRRVMVIDTPVSVYEEGQASSEFQNLLDLSRPGPHVLVLVVPLKHEGDTGATEWVQKVFGPEAIENTIILRAGEKSLDSMTMGQHAQKDTGELGMLEQFSGDQGLQAHQLLSEVLEIVTKHQNRPFRVSEKAKSSEQTQEKSEDLVVGKDEAIPSTVFPADPKISSDEPELRIILVGKTGTGKSATGNTILGEECFDSRFEFTPVTHKCQLSVKEWKKKRIVVIDTPAIFSSGVGENSPEVVSCRRLSLPGPHALVLVTQMGRFTEEDHQTAMRVKEIFGKESRKHTIVVFTRREDLRSQSLEKYVKHTGNKHLQRLLDECSNRYCGLNNSETGEEQEKQAEELLSKIEEMVRKNQGRPYCSVKLDKSSQTKLPPKKNVQTMEGTYV